MASSGKKKTTMAKLMRESRLRERRLDKQAKKDARKRLPVDLSDPVGGALGGSDGGVVLPGGGEPALATVVGALADA